MSAIDADAGARKALGGLGLAAGLAGLSIVNPGIKDAAIALLNRIFGLGLRIDAPAWVGWTLIALGVGLALLTFFGPDRTARTLAAVFGRAPGRTALVVKHLGFEPAPRDPAAGELPPAMWSRTLRHLTVDLAADIKAGKAGLRRAVAAQAALPSRLDAAVATDRDAAIVYCGIVQAPFQLFAGHQLSAWTAVETLEWDRRRARWHPLQPGAGPDLGVHRRDEAIGAGEDVGIAIEASYAVDTAEMVASVGAVGRVARISATAPKLDLVTHAGQVDAFADAFRAALDDLRASLAAGARVHVFCAAPMSVGFALGRRISRTLDPPIIVHAYERQGTPPFGWGVHVNPAGARPALVTN